MTSRARPAGRLLSVATAILLLAGLAIGLGTASASSPSPDTKTSLHIGMVEEPDNLNPFIGIQGIDYMFWHLNYDFLVGFDAKTLEPRPELATEWEVSESGKEWTFTIRDDSVWQDGVPVTARDVAFTFNYIVDNELLNLSTYTNGITRAEVIDDTHVKLFTSTPKANMLRMVVPILPEHIWSEVSGKAATTSYQNKPPIVGDGPFQLVEWKKGKFVRFEANPDYWGGAPKVDEVIFQLYTNPDTMSQDLKLGTIDGAVDIPVAQFKPLSSEEGITTSQSTSWNFIELAMNCYDSPDSKGNPVLKDQQFRQAVNWAMDRQKVIDIAFQGYATLGSSLVVPYSKYHWEPPADATFTYDPAKARQILEAAGYKDVDDDGYRETKDGKKLSLRFYATTDSTPNQTAGKLIVDWLKDVGIELDYQVIDAGTLINYQYSYTGDTYTPDWDMFIGMGPGRRPRLHRRHLHAAADRGLERLPVDGPRVHQAERRIEDDRRGAAHPDHPADAGDLLRGLSLRDPRLSLPARGLRHGRLAGLGARAGGGRGRAAGRRDLQLQQYRYVPVRRAQSRNGREGRAAGELGLAGRRPRRGARHGRRHVPPDAALPASAGRGVSGPSPGGPGASADDGTRLRARELGIEIGLGQPGPLNAITDVAGVRVGHATLIEGTGPLPRRPRPRAHGRHRDRAARGRDQRGAALRRLPPAERQRRAHGTRVDP